MKDFKTNKGHIGVLLMVFVVVVFFCGFGLLLINYK